MAQRSIPSEVQKRLHRHVKKKIDNQMDQLTRDAMNKMEDAVDAVQAQSRVYKKKVTRYIQNEPGKAVGMAFLVGLLIAIFLRTFRK